MTGFSLFMLWLVACLMFAYMLGASTPDGNMYDMGKENTNKAAACMMNFWLVDFIAWWAMAQVITSLDTGVEDLPQEGDLRVSSWPVIGVNFLTIMLLLFLCGAIHACNHVALARKNDKDDGHKNKLIAGSSKKYREFEDDEAEEDSSEAESTRE